MGDKTAGARSRSPLPHMNFPACIYDVLRHTYDFASIPYKYNETVGLRALKSERGLQDSLPRSGALKCSTVPFRKRCRIHSNTETLSISHYHAGSIHNPLPHSDLKASYFNFRKKTKVSARNSSTSDIHAKNFQNDLSYGEYRKRLRAGNL
jgi:hypothetical protein